MYWPDKVAKEIISSGKYKPYWVDDMFTPSGYAHIGALRGPIVHDLIFKSLKYLGEDVKFTYVVNDFDPIDGLPEGLQEKFSKYMGFPLRNVPSPEEGFESFADYFANDYKSTMSSLGVNPEYLSSYDMYKQGKFDSAIRIALDNAMVIQDIYQGVSGSKKKDMGWFPLQVVCENCGRLGTTRVFDWDGETVAYKCEENMVKWATGCGYEGRISPFGGNGKLPWKVDWPAHWSILGVTIEGAGKDHSSAGGSRDIAREICKRVFKIEEPYNLPYEFFLIGGKKMASSKGLGLKAREMVKLLPLEVGRFLFVRIDYRKAVDFDPNQTMAIPDLFDEYDRCFRAYLDKSDMDLSRTFEMSQIGELHKEVIFLPRFIDVVNYIQQASVDIFKKFEELKGSELTQPEKKLLEERIKYAKIWLDKYAPEKFKLSIGSGVSGKTTDLTPEQKEFLRKAAGLLQEISDPEDLQLKLYNLSKEMNLETKKAFQAIYLTLIGKEFGPKAAWFLLSYPKDEVIKRLEEGSK